MRELNLSERQFEMTLTILAEVDLTPLLAVLGGQGVASDFIAGLPSFRNVHEKRAFRRLEAVWSADADTLENAEGSKDLMDKLEAQAARKPIGETLEGLKAFFSGLGLSLSDTRAFSVASALKLVESLKEMTTPPADPPKPSLSAD